MVLYQIKEITLTNGPKERKRSTIIFDDPKMQIVGEFLMTDAPMIQGEILRDMEQVISGEKEAIEVNGNRFFVTMKDDVTKIEDLFTGMDGVETYPAYTMQTKELKELVEMWLRKIKA